MKSRLTRQAGFSLVEVALALMVVGVGMVAIFGVLPAGMEANKRAIDDAQVALFSEEVFNGFRAKSEMVPWSQVPTISLDNPVLDMWVAGTPLKVTPGQMSTNVYAAREMATIIDYALRYQLKTIPVSGDVLGLRLLVWNGQYGSASSLTNPAIFYTEIRRTRS